MAEPIPSCSDREAVGAFDASVVVPAHNEAAVISRCLSSLAQAALALDIVVVANGCTDDTADLARSHGARVIETATPNKSNALNLGDRSCTAFPRVYLDADVRLTPSALQTLILAVRKPGVLAVAPTPSFIRSGVATPVSWYYDVWTQLPHVQDGLFGAGVYVLSASGRDRFETFPNIVADDLFVSELFARTERLRLPDACSEVVPPATLRGLIRVKARVHAANYRLREVAAHSDPSAKNRIARLDERVRSFATLAASRTVGAKILWYAILQVAIKATSRVRVLRATDTIWLRDTSSREQ